jgi:hypothetical protein
MSSLTYRGPIIANAHRHKIWVNKWLYYKTFIFPYLLVGFYDHKLIFDSIYGLGLDDLPISTRVFSFLSLFSFVQVSNSHPVGSTLISPVCSLARRKPNKKPACFPFCFSCHPNNACLLCKAFNWTVSERMFSISSVTASFLLMAGLSRIQMRMVYSLLLLHRGWFPQGSIQVLRDEYVNIWWLEYELAFDEWNIFPS